MSLRYILRLIEAFFKRFKAIIAFGFIVGIVFFLIFYFLAPNFNSIHTRIGIAGKYTPDTIPEEIAVKLSQGLTKVDVNGNVNPSLASSWESSDGGKTWIFNIKSDLKWQDKKKVVSGDINYEFSDATIELIDDKTIKFKLDNNFSAFPVIVSKPIFKKGLVGTGEWKVKNITLAGGYLQKLIIENNKNDVETYKFYPSEARLQLAFKLGAVDYIENVQDISAFDGWSTVDIQKNVSYNNFVGIFLNTNDEMFKTKEIRQSLSYATSKEGFDGVRALNSTSPFSWSYNPLVKPYVRDLEKARDIKGLRIVLSTLPNLLKSAEKIKKDWEEAGAICEIQVVSTIPENYQTFLATVDIPKDPDQYSLWHSTQTSTNISKFKNARIDKLLEDGRTELDQEIRKKYYLDFQRFLVEEVPAIFLYHPVYYNIIRK